MMHSDIAKMHYSSQPIADTMKAMSRKLMHPAQKAQLGNGHRTVQEIIKTFRYQKFIVVLFSADG
jgi:hypothetical protein